MKWKKQLAALTLGLLFLWFLATFWAEKGGTQQVKHSADLGQRNALIIYNPDPFYNLDEQVCAAFAKGLQEKGITTKIATNKKVRQLPPGRDYDLYVLCANTYNFSPDRGIRKAVDSLGNLENKKVVAVTLGSGSTKRAQRKFERFLEKRDVELMESKAYWLSRPNDDARKDEKNTDVAVDMAYNLAKDVAMRMN